MLVEVRVQLKKEVLDPQGELLAMYEPAPGGTVKPAVVVAGAAG